MGISSWDQPGQRPRGLEVLGMMSSRVAQSPACRMEARDISQFGLPYFPLAVRTLGGLSNDAQRRLVSLLCLALSLQDSSRSRKQRLELMDLRLPAFRALDAGAVLMEAWLIRKGEHAQRRRWAGESGSLSANPLQAQSPPCLTHHHALLCLMPRAIPQHHWVWPAWLLLEWEGMLGDVRWGMNLETGLSSLPSPGGSLIPSWESPKGRAGPLESPGPRSPPLPRIVLAPEQSQGGHLIPAMAGGGGSWLSPRPFDWAAGQEGAVAIAYTALEWQEARDRRSGHCIWGGGLGSRRESLRSEACSELSIRGGWAPPKVSWRSVWLDAWLPCGAH
ncbi:hypothetical protein Cadr_000020406 [Camelus dromedarius]|uniref:Uncharacterized protein n=1 Tax=Camelus dromedarius TaxID=9838 RepID=A0A5N4D020_CAMDR|nr:hypothetical protein Cadr_000020406 [Camelus dromedarius]